MPVPAIGAGLAAAGIAGSLLGKKTVPPVDITDQLAQLKGGIGQSRLRVDDLYNKLQPLTSQYATDTNAALEGSRADLEGQKADYLGSIDKNTAAAKDALRANLYSNTFNGLPDALRAVREAAAAGGGVDSGAYNNAVTQVGVNTASTLANGERDLQLQGLQDQNSAQTNAFNTFSQLSSKLNDQKLDMLTKVMDSGRADLVQKTASQLGLDQEETQGIIDLMNFQQSGNLASSSADASNQQALYDALINSGASLLARK